MPEQFKKFFINILKAIGYLTTGYFTFIILLALLGTTLASNLKDLRGKWGYSLLRYSEIKNYSGVDICFLGSSNVYRGFDNRIFSKAGYSNYNLGSSSQTPFNSYFLLKEHITTLNPKVVIIDTYWNVLTLGEGTESAIDLVCNNDISWNMVEMAWKTKDPLVLNSLLYSYVRRSFVKYEQTPFEGFEYIPGGFVYSYAKSNEPDFNKLIKPIKPTLDKKQLTYLEKTIKLCQDNKVKVILIRTPVTVELIRSLKGNYDELTVKPIKALAAKYGCIFWDFNAGSTSDFNSMLDFTDANHLNQRGVEKFNHHLISKLKSSEISNFYFTNTLQK